MAIFSKTTAIIFLRDMWEFDPKIGFGFITTTFVLSFLVCFFLIHRATHCHCKHMGPYLDLFCLAPCRQVLPSSSCMSREAGSWVQRREPTPGQSTWGRETLWALFPLWRLHVKWVLAWWDTQTPLEGKALHSLPPIEERDTEGLLKMHLWSRHRRHRLCLFQYTQQ